MKKVRIAIIDSGVSEEVAKDFLIKQYYVNCGNVIKENNIDVLGHGSAMVSIICRYLNVKCEIISLRIAHGSDNKIDKLIDIEDICEAIEYAVENEYDIVSISVGVSSYSKRALERLQSICSFAVKRNIIIITSANADNKVVYPWACRDVIKVIMGKDNDNSIAVVKDKYDNYVLAVNKRFIKANCKKEGTKFLTGNSAATALVTALLANSFIGSNGKESCLEQFFFENNVIKLQNFKMEDLYGTLKLVKRKFSIVSRDLTYIKRVAIVPFSKEMISLLRFKDNEEFEIKQVIDPVIKGNNGRDPFEVLNIGSSEIKISNRINFEKRDIDTIVIGYVDKISRYDKYFALENLIKLAYKNNVNVFSLDLVEKSAVITFKKNH